MLEPEALESACLPETKTGVGHQIDRTERPAPMGRAKAKQVACRKARTRQSSQGSPKERGIDLVVMAAE